MSKRKHGEMPMTEAEAAVLGRLRDELPADAAFLAPFLEELHKQNAPRPKLPTRPATWFKSVRSAVQALGLKYDYDDFKPKETAEEKVKELSPHFATVINELTTSQYIGAQVDETFSRTILDLILIDRLQQLEDKDIFGQLILSSEVPASVEIEPLDPIHEGTHELVRGRADWALGYGRDKMCTRSILIVVEAKRQGSASTGLPQMLVYMAAVHEARRGYANKSVFGMLSDTGEFKFAFLDSNKKLYLSRTLTWSPKKSDQQVIISCIDMMLLDAIQSSPYTTPIKTQNHIVRRYRRYMTGKWAFGADADDKDESESEEGEARTNAYMDEGMAIYEPDCGDIVDIVKVNGRIVVRKAANLE